MEHITLKELAEPTVLGIITLVKGDPKATAEGKRRIIDALTSPHADEPKPERVLTVGEVAARIGKTRKTVHLYCKMGLLKKAKFGAQSRASGILASSLDALLSGATATVA